MEVPLDNLIPIRYCFVHLLNFLNAIQLIINRCILNKADFKQGLLKRDDVLLINNSRVGDYRSDSYLDIGSEGRLRTKRYDKRYYLNFLIVNFLFICSNIPAAPAYGVYISQLIRYSRGCGSYQDFLDKGLLLTRKLLNQGFLLVKMKSSLRKFYGRHHNLVDSYGISVSQMTTDTFHLSQALSGPFLIHDLSPGLQLDEHDACHW